MSFLEVKAKFCVNLHMSIILGKRYTETDLIYKGDCDPNPVKNYYFLFFFFFNKITLIPPRMHLLTY